MTQRFVNNFVTTVAATFGSIDTTLQVTSTTGLPALTGDDYLLLTVYRLTGIEEREHEVVKVTSWIGNMLTVERAIEGAAASQFLAGDPVEARVTAGALTAKADLLALTQANVGLPNVDNTSDVNKPVSTAQATADAAILASANAHSDALVVGLWDDRGNYDASVNTFPATGGSGAAGAILKGDIWTISVAGTLGTPVAVRQTARALVDTPGQSVTNWSIGLANTDLDDSITDGVTGRAPSQNAVFDALALKQDAAAKDATGGYAGLTQYKLNLKNAANTFTNFLTNATTAARTYTLQDRDGTLADNTDLATKQATLVSGTNIKTVNGTTLLGASDIVLAGLAGNTFTGAQAYGDQQNSRAMLIDCGITVLDKGNSGTATQTLDYTAGSVQKITATGAFTIATSNWPPTGNWGVIQLEAVNFGAFVVTWPTINWIKPDGTTTTSIATYLAAVTGRVAFQSSGLDKIKLESSDAGTTIYGRFA